jgi:hypothetical protein
MGFVSAAKRGQYDCYALFGKQAVAQHQKPEFAGVLVVLFESDEVPGVGEEGYIASAHCERSKANGLDCARAVPPSVMSRSRSNNPTEKQTSYPLLALLFTFNSSVCFRAQLIMKCRMYDTDQNNRSLLSPKKT